MKVRFAPSPTGYLHIGNARTAIINHFIAKKYDAEYVLRIEDTDMERSTKDSETSIIDDLKWLGIEWTEGPDQIGECGPYRQSERFDIYKKFTSILLEQKKAYKCFCSPDELDVIRKDALASGVDNMYDGRCSYLSDDEISAKASAGMPYTIRFKVPENEKIVIEDHIKGEVVFNSSNIGGDFIIVRSDGVPVYNYIVVIDDELMKVTDVVRGEDHLSNTPKQILVSNALGFERKKYAHMPLVLGDDRKKLSKRHGITSVDLYRKEGYLPEALVNYIVMLGWASETGEEILSLDEIVRQVDIKSLARSAAVFDFQKLRWMNSHYIKNADEDRIVELMKPYIAEAGYDLTSYEQNWLKEVVLFLRSYCSVLSDIKEQIAIFLEEFPMPGNDEEDILKSESGQLIIDQLRNMRNSNELSEELFSKGFVDTIKEKTGLKGKNLFMPCRILLTSCMHGPDLEKIISLLGFKMCVKRINNIIDNY